MGPGPWGAVAINAHHDAVPVPVGDSDSEAAQTASEVIDNTCNTLVLPLAVPVRHSDPLAPSA